MASFCRMISFVVVYAFISMPGVSMAAECKKLHYLDILSTQYCNPGTKNANDVLTVYSNDVYEILYETTSTFPKSSTCSLAFRAASEEQVLKSSVRVYHTKSCSSAGHTNLTFYDSFSTHGEVLGSYPASYRNIEILSSGRHLTAELNNLDQCEDSIIMFSVTSVDTKKFEEFATGIWIILAVMAGMIVILVPAWIVVYIKCIRRKEVKCQVMTEDVKSSGPPQPFLPTYPGEKPPSYSLTKDEIEF